MNRIKDRIALPRILPASLTVLAMCLTLPAVAGHYGPAEYSGGTYTLPVSPWSANYSSYGGGWGGHAGAASSSSATATCQGQITVTFHWIPDYDGEQPPTHVLLVENSTATYDATQVPDQPSGHCDNGIGSGSDDHMDELFATIPVPPYHVHVGWHTYGTCTGTRSTLVPGTDPLVWQCTPGSTATTAYSTPTCSVSYSAAISSKIADLTTPDPKVTPTKGNSANKYYFVFDPDTGNSVLNNPKWVMTFTDANAADYLSATSFDSYSVGSSTRTQGDKQATASTISQQFTYTNLPAGNGDFGNKTVTGTVAAADIDVTRTARVQIYYQKGDHDHPLPDLPAIEPNPEMKTPNWYFYYSQITSVNVGTHYYGSNAPGFAHTGLTYFDKTGNTHFNQPKNTWVSLIGSTAAGGPSLVTGWGGAEGIDLFAWVCRHEKRHLDDMIFCWGANSGVDRLLDWDDDYLPDEVEEYLGLEYHDGYSCLFTATYDDHFRYGAGWSDCEDYCLHRQASWNNGSADGQDWAQPGHQY